VRDLLLAGFFHFVSKQQQQQQQQQQEQFSDKYLPLDASISFPRWLKFI
jgi:hypothetical protein